jgi:glycosyltransferase involved in cell wall biosynthesis
MKISFVCCSNICPPLWLQLFSSIADQTTADTDIEIVAINNGFPSDRTQLLRKHPSIIKLGNRFRLIEEPTPGIAHSRARGMREARGDWLVFLDDDNTIAPDFITALSKELSNSNSLGGLVALITPVWEKPVPEWLARFGVLCLSYTSPSLDDDNFVPQHLSCEQAREFSSPPGGGMIIHQTVAHRYLNSPNLKQRLQWGRVGKKLYGCDDNDLWNEIFPLKRGVLISDKVRIQHHIPCHRTKIHYLIRLNFQMSYSFGWMDGTRNTSAPKSTLWQHLKQAKRHLMKALRRGSLGAELLWWVKSVGYDCGLRRAQHLHNIQSERSA